MSGNLTNAEENALLDARLAGVYVALFTADPGEAGSLTAEVSGGSYVRQLAGLTAASGGAKANAADVTWPVATAAWGTITHLGLIDAVTAGTLRWYGPLGASKAIDTGDVFKILAGQLSVSVD